MFMNPHFQACGRGTGPFRLPYPHPNKAEANVCFQASSNDPEVKLRKALPVPFKYSGKFQDKPHSGMKTRTISNTKVPSSSLLRLQKTVNSLDSRFADHPHTQLAVPLKRNRKKRFSL